MFQSPRPCPGCPPVVTPAPFWWYIWPNSWVAKEAGGWGANHTWGAILSCLICSFTVVWNIWACPARGSPWKLLEIALTFQHARPLPSEGERGWTGREPGWPTGGPFVWEIVELVSANSAHLAVIVGSDAGRRRGGCSGAHLRCSSRATRPRCLAAQRKRQPGDSTGGEVCSAVPLSFASRFWLGFGFGEVCCS